MAGLVSISSFSSLYDLVSSPLRPSSPIDYSPGEPPSHATPAFDDRLVHHHVSSEEHSTPRQALQPPSSHPGSPLAHAQEPELQLTTECQACGACVVMKMPAWLSNMNRTRIEYEQAMWEAQMARQACNHEQVGPSRRDRVVAIAVGGAKAFRESPLPGILLLMLRTLIALAFYLDQRFAIRERGMRVFWSIIADLQYVEKETGMMRQSGETIGEWLSVIWEAVVKGAIALANPEVPMRAGQFDRRGSTLHRNTTSHAPPSSYDYDSHSMHPSSFPFPSSAMPFEYSTPQSYPSPANLRQYTTSSTSTTHSSASSSYLQQPFAYQSQPRGHRVPLTPDESDGDDEGLSDYLDQDSSTSSANTTMPDHSFTSPKKRRTLRRMANSVPSFHLAGANDEASSRSLGITSPDGRRAGAYASPTPGRPRMPRQRSRSGPDETSSATARRAGESLQVPVGGQGRGGWMAQTMAGVVGRVL